MIILKNFKLHGVVKSKTLVSVRLYSLILYDIHDMFKTKVGLNIKRLKLRGCPGITQLNISAPQLEYLCLEKCLQVSSLEIDAPNLYRLELKGCANVKKAYLKCMYIKVLDVDVCQQLRYIHFDSFANVTMNFVQKLQFIAPNLVTLNLKGSKVTDEVSHGQLNQNGMKTFGFHSILVELSMTNCFNLCSFSTGSELCAGEACQI